jgi:ribosome-associated protein
MARYDSSAMQDALVSKTQQKRAMHELRALGVALVDLPDSQLAAMTLPESLASAIAAARGMKEHGAKRRQLQLIGKLMRDVDAEPIREQLAALRGQSAQAAAHQRRLESWRTRLLDDDEALTAFAQEHPGADLQALRTAIRNARREQASAKPPRAYREIFRLLREAMAASAS